MVLCYRTKKSTNRQTLCSKNYVANTVFNTAIPAYFGQKKCATSALRTIRHAPKVKSLIYIDKW